MTIILKGSDASEITIKAKKFGKVGNDLTIELEEKDTISPEPEKGTVFKVSIGTKDHGQWTLNSYNYGIVDTGFSNHQLFFNRPAAPNPAAPNPAAPNPAIPV